MRYQFNGSISLGHSSVAADLACARTGRELSRRGERKPEQQLRRSTT